MYEAHGRQPLTDEVRYKEALCYEGLGDFVKATELYEQVIDSESVELSKLGLFQEGLLFFEQERYALSGHNFKAFGANHAGDPLADEAVYLKGVTEALDGNLESARATLMRIRSEGGRYAASTRAMMEDLNDLENTAKKSPGLAGTLSGVVPGAGQWYAGRRADGVAAFGVNAVLGGLVAAAFLNDEEVLGGILAFLESWFYTGNIYSARNATQKYNRERKEEVLNRILRQVRFDVVHQQFGPQVRALFTVEFGRVSE